MSKIVWVDLYRRQVESFAVRVADTATNEQILAAVRNEGFYATEPADVEVLELTETVREEASLSELAVLRADVTDLVEETTEGVST